jgi:hypothetical protein
MYYIYNTYFDTVDNAWFTPFSFELTFRRMFEHVDAFIRCIVLAFMHCVNTPTASSATCFTFAVTGEDKCIFCNKTRLEKCAPTTHFSSAFFATLHLTDLDCALYTEIHYCYGNPTVQKQNLFSGTSLNRNHSEQNVIQGWAMKRENFKTLKKIDT